MIHSKAHRATRLLALTAALLQAPAAAGGGSGAIATAHPSATKAGVEALASGGNAFDAAVAITAALAVAEPYSSGLGGGGFYLLYIAKDERYVFVDARERAPLAAGRDMYLDEDGSPIAEASLNGALAAGIPGIPAALEHLARHYGKQDLARLLRPAVALAERGFPSDAVLARMAQYRLTALRAHPSTSSVFLRGGKPPEPGDKLVQTDLAATLRALARRGASAFYKGGIARRLVSAVRADGGIWTMKDLASYTIIEREPISIAGAFGTLISAPPPSSGGIALAQILGQLRAFAPLAAFDPSQASHLHRLIESMRRAYRDRAVFLGDPDFITIPIDTLASPEYAAGLAATIHSRKATPSEWLEAVPPAAESAQTTHFSIIDGDGNIVSATLSINYPFGSGLIAAGTGVLLNNEMDDFSAKPGAANVYGLVGSTANAIEPGKRMLSSMTPSILRQHGCTIAIGTPGGSRIITMVAQGLLAALAGKAPQAIVDAPRLHHQMLPDAVFVEPAYFADGSTAEALEALGHSIKGAERPWGNMQLATSGAECGFGAASDERGIGQSWAQGAD